MFADTHCHLSYFDEAEVINVLKRCDESGVGYLQNICTSVSEIDGCIAFAKKYKNVSTAIGVHPCNVESDGVVSVEYLSNIFLSNKNFVNAVGETGLDYYHKDTPEMRELQKKSLINHIDFASKYNLPVVIHCRSADDDFENIASSLIKEKHFNCVMHCFSSNRDFMFKMLDLGFYISFSGIVTFHNAQELQECAKVVPLDRMLIETDSPYLSPVPMRGKKNEPSYVHYVALFLSKLLGKTPQEIGDITTRNYCKLFNV